MRTRGVTSTSLSGALALLCASGSVHAELEERDNFFDGIIELRTADGIGVIELSAGPSPATDRDARVLADTILALANGDPARGLLPSPTFEAIMEEATANRAGKLQIKVDRNSSAVALGNSNAEGAKGLSPSQAAFDLADFELVAASPKVLELEDESLRADAVRLVFLAVVAHEIRHSGIGKERIVTEDGRVELRDRKDGEDQYPDPEEEPTIRESPAKETDNVPLGSAAKAENDVMAETLAGSGFGYVRNNYGYKRETDGHQVYDFTITVPRPDGPKKATVVFNITELERLLSATDEARQALIRDDGFKLDEIPELGVDPISSSEADAVASTGADASDAADGGEATGGQTPDPGSGASEPGTDDGGTSDEGDPPGETGSSGEGERFACTPDTATMSGRAVPQAGVEVDVAAQTCEAVSGLPPGDLLVIDDFGGTFGGSGSGATVLDVEGGSFVNEDTFYTLTDLLVGEPVEVTFEGDDQSVFTVEFTIDDTGAGSALTDVAVTLEA